MFEDILTNIKAHSAKVTESLSLENLRAQGSKLTDNFDNLKAQTSKISGNIITTLKKSTPRYLLVSQNDDSPTQLVSENCNSPAKRELKWPVLVDNKMQWVTIPQRGASVEDEDDIVERFIRVISVEDEKPFTAHVRKLREYCTY